MKTTQPTLPEFLNAAAKIANGEQVFIYRITLANWNESTWENPGDANYREYSYFLDEQLAHDALDEASLEAVEEEELNIIDLEKVDITDSPLWSQPKEDLEDFFEDIKDDDFNSSLCLNLDTVFITFNYKPIDKDIIVEWSWQTYIGYARKFIGLKRGAYYGSTAQALVTGNENRVFKTCTSVILSDEEVVACDNNDDLAEAVYDALSHLDKWQNMPSYEDVLRMIEEGL